MEALVKRPFGTAPYIDTQSNWFSLDYPYLEYLRHIYMHGVDKADRTGTGARSIFGYMIRFNLQVGIPLLTTKLVPQKTVFDELKWFLEGSTNNHRLREINQMHSKQDWSKKDTIWEEWADPITGKLGPIYSEQWRRFPGNVQLMRRDQLQLPPEAAAAFFADEDNSGVVAVFHGIDQIQNAITMLKNSPDSRRIIVSAWNPGQIDQMALPPCHVLFQFYTRPATIKERQAYYRKHFSHIGTDNELTEEYLDNVGVPSRVVCCMLYQRSADSFLGVPFNIVSYSMLTYKFAHQAGMIAGDFIWVGGDCHIYSNHFDQVEEQLSRTPSEKIPQLSFNRKPNSIFEYDWTDLSITDYEPQAAIAAPVAK